MRRMRNFIRINKFLLFIFVLTLVFFYKQLLNPYQTIFPAFDLHNTYAFLRMFFVESVRKYGEIPLWNPFSFSGEPFLANSQSAMFYPINILYFVSSPELVFGFIYMLDFFLLGTFTYFFAREIKLEKFSSFISAITMMFSGIITTKVLSGHIVILDSIVWFPLLMLLYEKSVSTNKTIYFIISGIPIGLMLLAGNVQIAYYSLFISLVYLLFRVIHEGLRNNHFFKKVSQGLIIVCTSMLIGFSLAAVQLIPSYELSQISIRAGGLSYEWASDFSFHPYQWISMLLPHFFGYPMIANTYWGYNGNFWEICAYTGIFPLLLVFLLIILKRNRLIYFFFFLAVFSLLFSSGKFSFIFPIFFNNVPGFTLFRAPARFLYIYGFSISVIAGISCDVLLSEKMLTKYKKLTKQFSLSLIVLLCIILLTLIAIFLNAIDIQNILQTYGYAIGNNLKEIRSLVMKDLLMLLLLTFFSIGIIIVRIKNLTSIRNIKMFIFLLIIFDLWMFGLKLYSTKNIKDVYPIPSQLKIIKKDNSEFRALDIDGDLIGLTGRNNIRSLTGINALHLENYKNLIWLSGSHPNNYHEDFINLLNIKNLNILKLLNTKYIVSKQNIFYTDLSELSPAGTNLYEIRNSLPEAYIVPNAIVASSRADSLKKLQDQNFNPKENVILENKPDVPINNPSVYTPVEIARYEPNRIELKKTLRNPGFLVLSEIWYPGWRAYDNNKELKIYIADYALRSIYLNKGNHNITFVYDPRSYKLGSIISIISLSFLMLYFGISVLVKRSNKITI